MIDIGQPVRDLGDGQLGLDEAATHKPCHGYSNGCVCGCKPGKPRGSAWTQNPERGHRAY